MIYCRTFYAIYLSKNLKGVLQVKFVSSYASLLIPAINNKMLIWNVYSFNVVT